MSEPEKIWYFPQPVENDGSGVDLIDRKDTYLSPDGKYYRVILTGDEDSEHLDPRCVAILAIKKKVVGFANKIFVAVES